jgi:uncharacterized low-complexity protein
MINQSEGGTLRIPSRERTSKPATLPLCGEGNCGNTEHKLGEGRVVYEKN